MILSDSKFGSIDDILHLLIPSINSIDSNSSINDSPLFTPKSPTLIPDRTISLISDFAILFIIFDKSIKSS